MRTNNANTVDELKANMQAADKRNAYVQRSQMVSDAMKDEAAMDAAYQVNTDLLAQMNESWNANRYIERGVQKESDRLTRGEVTGRKNIYALRSRELQARFATNYNGRVAFMAALTLVVTLLALLVAAMFRAQRLGLVSLVAILGILIALYTVYVVYVVRQMGMMRLDSEWGKVRWASEIKANADVVNQEASCPNDDANSVTSS